MRISDWSSDVCSSDLLVGHAISRLYGSHVSAVLDGHRIALSAGNIGPGFAATALGVPIDEDGHTHLPFNWRTGAGCPGYPNAGRGLTIAPRQRFTAEPRAKSESPASGICRRYTHFRFKIFFICSISVIWDVIMMLTRGGTFG